jgi:hypothetical protein
MPNSIALKGLNKFIATDVSSNKTLFDFNIDIFYNITSDSVLSGEITLTDDTDVLMSDTASHYYIYAQLVDDPSNVGVEILSNTTVISSINLGEIMFLKNNTNARFYFKQATAGTEPSVVKYFIIEF